MIKRSTIEAIAAMLPHVKIIVCVRDPLERLKSEYVLHMPVRACGSAGVRVGAGVLCMCVCARVRASERRVALPLSNALPQSHPTQRAPCTVTVHMVAMRRGTMSCVRVRVWEGPHMCRHV